MNKEELNKLPLEKCWDVCGLSDYEEVKKLTELALSDNKAVAIRALCLVAKLKRPEARKIIQPTQINIGTDKDEKKALVQDIISGISDQTKPTG